MTTTTCVHHWIIAPANGPTSTGTCQYCGEVREFDNFIDLGEFHLPLKLDSKSNA